MGEVDAEGGPVPERECQLREGSAARPGRDAHEVALVHSHGGPGSASADELAQGIASGDQEVHKMTGARGAMSSRRSPLPVLREKGRGEGEPSDVGTCCLERKPPQPFPLYRREERGAWARQTPKYGEYAMRCRLSLVYSLLLGLCAASVALAQEKPGESKRPRYRFPEIMVIVYADFPNQPEHQLAL